MKIILCGVLLLSQVQTTPQTAGERYKSVRELKDIPGSQVIEVMSVIAGSLGVTCAPLLDYEDYRDVEGVKLPQRLHWSRADYSVMFTLDRLK